MLQEQYNATDFVNLRILPAERDPTVATAAAAAFRSVYGIEQHMGGYNNPY